MVKKLTAVLFLLTLTGCDPCAWLGGSWCPPPAEEDEGVVACETDSDCSDEQFCFDRTGMCEMLAGELCVRNEHCLDGEVCLDGSCGVSNPCDPDAVVDNRCVPGTTNMAEVCAEDVQNQENGWQWREYACGDGDHCASRANGSGQCVELHVANCFADEDCQIGYQCVAEECVARPACNPEPFEVCGDGYDNNCDGRIDENCLACDQDEDCAQTNTRLCSADLRPFSFSALGECSLGVCMTYYREIDPRLEATPELCDDGMDNDCDGLVDEDCDARLEGYLSPSSPNGFTVPGMGRTVLRFALMAIGAEIQVRSFRVRAIQPEGRNFLTGADLSVKTGDENVTLDQLDTQIVIPAGESSEFLVQADILPPPDANPFAFYVEVFDIIAVNTMTAEIVFLRDDPESVIRGNVLLVE